MNHLSLNNISKSYKKNIVLKNINLEFQQGDLVGIIGRNGAGKSTLFKVISGLTLPDQGYISCDNKTINTRTLSWKQKIGFLPEYNPLYHDLTVVEFLDFFANLSNIENPKSRVDHVIQQLELENYAKIAIEKLSKGYKQRVGIGQAILHHPELLILDEPTSGLDPNQLKSLRNLIKSLSDQRLILISSHNLREIEKICNKVVLLDNGQIKYDKSIGQSMNTLIKLTTNSQDQTWTHSLGTIVESIDDTQIILQLNDSITSYDVFDAAVRHRVKIGEIRPVEKEIDLIFSNNKSVI